MARALFFVAKRAWYEDQQRRWPRTDPPDPPVPGEAWYADPSTLQIQISRLSPPRDEGTSVKIDPDERDISKAFRPRPFLIVSNENILNQGRAWVCPLSSSAELSSAGPMPDWVVPIPELNTFCLTSKLHTIDTEFFDDLARRDLLRPMSVVSVASMQRVRAMILQYLDGAFAPTEDPLPPGSIIRYANGIERMVVANCNLGTMYRGGTPLSTTCLVEHAADVSAEDRDRPVPDLIPFPAPASWAARGPIGYVDLVDMHSESQARLMKKRVRTDLTALAGIRAAFRELLLGEDSEAKR